MDRDFERTTSPGARRRAGAAPEVTGDLIEPLTLHLPALPPALAGLSILLISDLHVRAARRRHDRLVEALPNIEADLLVLAGDYMNDPGDEPIAQQVIGRIVSAARPRLGAFGVWGNHDSPELRTRLAHLPVRWLVNSAWTHERLPLLLLGVDCAVGERRVPRGDLLTALSVAPPADEARFSILLSHLPNWMTPASEAGVHLVLAGHTHGGQVRLPGGAPLMNMTPGWPLRLSSGILQARRTLGVVGRGIGESFVDGLRFFCSAHAPLITLQRADSPLSQLSGVECLQRW